jgi:phosphomethylpyrimidine synthase
MCGPKFCSMKITQEVRDFARLQEQAADSSSLSLLGEGDRSPRTRSGENGGGVGADALTQTDADEGMAEMSRAYNEGGRELYIGAGAREHD